MNKNAIKNFAIQARLTLIDAVSQRAFAYEVSEKSVTPANADVIAGHPLSREEKEQRQQLVAQVEAKGFRQVMEEAAYTWFNRFIALRYMEVNEYLPTGIRVFTDAEGKFSPEILKEALTVELIGLNREQVITLLEKQDNEALYKLLLLAQCNDLGEILPGMFQRINNWTELLFPANLLKPGSVLDRMVSDIPAEDWQEQVQIIGWLYQYYNTEPKDKVFSRPSGEKIKKEDIPAATQLFTPDWIVRYMVENSLGRLWVEGHPETTDRFLPTEEEQAYFRETHQDKDPNKPTWHYYLPEAEQEPEVQAQLAEIRKEYAALTPEEIKVIDPCMGSGHILAYMFDVLMQIYGSYGYSPREAVASIVRNNIYGLDIDDRAAQLAYFSVMMKARQYDRRFFSRGIQPNVYSIQESNGLDRAAMDYFCNGDAGLTAAMKSMTKELYDAKEYGSILNVTPVDFEALYSRFDEIFDEDSMFAPLAWNQLLPFVKCAEAMAQKYHAVVTNPPYLSSGNMDAKVSQFVGISYPDSKSDLCTCFIEKSFMMLKRYGFSSMITMESWMSLSSFKNMRAKLLSSKTVSTMVHMPYLGKGGTSLGINFGTAATVIRNDILVDYAAIFDRVIYLDCDEEGTPFSFPVINEYYNVTKVRNFFAIPGSPLSSYYASKEIFDSFSRGKYIADIATPASGTSTGDNDSYLRLWHEVPILNINFNAQNNKYADGRWFPCNKGGAYRKWAGGAEYVIDWENDGYRIKNCPKAFLRNVGSIFLPGLTWSKLGSGAFSVRQFDKGFICESIGCCLFERSEDLRLILALLNGKVGAKLLSIINPSMGRQPGYIGAVPFVMPNNYRKKVCELTDECVEISLEDWNIFETSWDFQQHPLVLWSRGLWDCTNIDATMHAFYGDEKPKSVQSPLELCYLLWQGECEQRFNQLKANEEELNRIFIDIYGLQDELPPEVEDKDVTVRKADLQRDIKSLISYAVGCMFGRYSLDKQGLCYAGGDWNSVFRRNCLADESGNAITFGGISIAVDNDFQINDGNEWHDCTFSPDVDNILPICDDDYFPDDIVGRFVAFIRTAYGDSTLEENLKFIADALGSKGQPREVIRNYFLNDFYADHLKIYQKRPIYWLFDSGKKNGFKALIYMHRYQPDTIAKIRTDYVHEQQSRYRTAITDLEDRVEHAAASERVKLNKQLAKLKDQDLELRKYEEEVHHLSDQMIAIDLDDGVKVNYAKFEKVLAKIK